MNEINQTLTQIQEEVVKKLKYNSHDMGEMGVFIRLEYAENIIKSFLTQSNLRVIEKVNKDIKQIMNRCKTERGLGIALANYLSTLIEQK